MKARLAGMFVVTAVLASLFAGLGRPASGQEFPPNQTLTFYGEVLISGGTDPDGMVITARIDDWESKPIVVGNPLEGSYQFIFIDAPLELLSNEIVFWLDDQVQADERVIEVYLGR